MASSIQLAAALALTLLATACSSAGGSAGAGPATARVAAERQMLPAEETETISPVEAPSAVGARRQPVTTPLTALSQIVTTQALLVSLLLAPVSPGARAASPPEPAPPKASGPARSN